VNAKWSVEVDGHRCIGSGMCAFTAADVFDVGDSGIAVVIGEIRSDDERIPRAVEGCPTGALTLRQGDAA
jgi:ferredoxin